ncbi:hypothetical protein F4860DRAFT_327165 [Xylaria cubensis]|nr:hypothetical protein F4860DRAFT_327165 [Xylaria cubensis]
MSGNILNHRAARVLCSASCPVNHIDNQSRIKKTEGWPDIRGLNSLNASRTSWLAADAIEKSIAVYVRGLPDALQEMIGLDMLALNALIWHMPSQIPQLSAQYEKGRDLLHKSIMAPPRRLVNRFKRTEYNIFPLCVNNNHWVLVVIHKNQVPSATDPSTKEWSRIVQAAVIDPQRSTATTDFVHSTMRRWFTEAAGFTFAPHYVKNVWVPYQRDNNSCGPRAYWNAKQILDRLLELHENGINYEASLWSELSGWFNEGFVREEMRGRCAAAAVREMDYFARVAVELVNRTKEFSVAGGIAEWGSAQMLKPEDMTGQKPESRPTNYRGGQLGGQGLEDLVPPENTHTADYSSGGLNTNPNNNNNNGFQPPAGPIFIPPAPIPNQHRIAPGVSPARQTHAVRAGRRDAAEAGSSSSMSPTFPPPTPVKNPLGPPSTPANPINPTPSQSGKGKQKATDLTGGVRGLNLVTPTRLGPPIPFSLGASSGSLGSGSKPFTWTTGASFLASAPAAAGASTTPSLGTGVSNPIVLGDDDDEGAGPSGSQPAHVPSPEKTPGKRLASDSNIASPPKRQKVEPQAVASPVTPRGAARGARGARGSTRGARGAAARGTTRGAATGAARGARGARGAARGARGTRAAARAAARAARGGTKRGSKPAPRVYESDENEV